jgi:hypothetical protein
LIRQVAGFDIDRMRTVMDWPLRDMLLSYLERMTENAWRGYELEMLVWAALAPHQKRKKDPPALPRVLRG